MAQFSPEQWNVLSPHLDSALSMDESGRKEYLASLRASDPSLASELDALLAESRNLGSFLEGTALQPESIGPYRIVGTLGEGGMGIVYLGEQQEPVRRRLAIKVIRLLGGRHLIARFESERQALAMMEHPNIARLYEASVTAEGHPFFAMEYVDGTPITTYCDEKKLSCRDRLKLFQQVCGAVQHAHQKGVIHRDLKPSNILVVEQDGAPAPKVIDFGLAKALDHRLSDQTLHTEVGVRMGTLRYMSPEQELGADVDSTTDIYSLGVLLYELLTSVTPRDFIEPGEEVRSPLVGLNQAKEPEAIAANRGTTPAGLERLIRGDLEWITLKALERDRALRYASASEFASDIGRYLEDDVVLAHAPGAALRFRKLVRRHRVASAVALAIVGGFAATGVTAAIAIRERSNAQQRMIEMRQLAGKLLFDLHDEISAVPGATKAKEKLAVTSSEYLQKLESQGKVDPEVAFELSSAYSRLSNVRGWGIGDTKSGVDYGRRALEFGRHAEGKRDLGNAKLLELFQSYVRIFDTFHEAGLAREDWSCIERLFAIANRLADSDQISAKALVHKIAGQYYDRFESAAKAVSEHKQAVDLYRQETRHPEKLAKALGDLARSLGRVGDFDAALASFEESLKLEERLVAEHPSNAAYSRSLYLLQVWLGDLLGDPTKVNLGKPEAAVKHYEEAIRMAEAAVAADPRNETAKLDVARSCGKLGSVFSPTEPARALALMDRSAEMIRGTSFGNKSGKEMRAAYLTESVTPLVALGRLDQARRNTDEARKMMEAGEVDKGAETRVVRKEAEWMYKAGRQKEALQAALRVKDLVADGVDKDTLSSGYQLVLALEAIEKYARKIDPSACSQAAAQVAEFWDKAQSRYTTSEIVKSKAREAKTRANDPANCPN